MTKQTTIVVIGSLRDKGLSKIVADNSLFFFFFQLSFWENKMIFYVNHLLGKQFTWNVSLMSEKKNKKKNTKMSLAVFVIGE